MKTLVKINIPAWLRSNMMLKEASFDIPDNVDGQCFLGWWDQADKHSKHAVIKLSQERGVSLVEALRGHLEAETPPELG